MFHTLASLLSIIVTCLDVFDSFQHSENHKRLKKAGWSEHILDIYRYIIHITSWQHMSTWDSNSTTKVTMWIISVAWVKWICNGVTKKRCPAVIRLDFSDLWWAPFKVLQLWRDRIKVTIKRKGTKTYVLCMRVKVLIFKEMNYGQGGHGSVRCSV